MRLFKSKYGSDIPYKNKLIHHFKYDEINNKSYVLYQDGSIEDISDHWTQQSIKKWEEAGEIFQFNVWDTELVFQEI